MTYDFLPDDGKRYWKFPRLMTWPLAFDMPKSRAVRSLSSKPRKIRRAERAAWRMQTDGITIGVDVGVSGCDRVAYAVLRRDDEIVTHILDAGVLP